VTPLPGLGRLRR